MTDKKKKVAAIAAVIACMRRDTAAVELHDEGGEGVSPSPRPGLSPWSPWGLSGRQAQMQMRTLVQMRAMRNLR